MCYADKTARVAGQRASVSMTNDKISRIPSDDANAHVFTVQMLLGAEK